MRFYRPCVLNALSSKNGAGEGLWRGKSKNKDELKLKGYELLLNDGS